MPFTGYGPNDPNWVYYTARAALVCLWLWACYRAYSLSRLPQGRSRRLWSAVALTSFYLGLLRATRLDWRLKFWAQNRLEGRGFEDALRAGEMVLFGGIILSTVTLLFVYRLQARRGHRAPALALVAALIMVLFTLWETFSVDELIPTFLLTQLEGRYPLELLLVTTVLLGTRER